MSTARVAVLGNLHCTKSSQGAFQPLLASIREAADLLLIAGDLTDYGLPEEAQVLVRELNALRLPVVAVLGNHDLESGKATELKQILTDGGVVVLDGDACEVLGVGVAGITGFGGGFGKHALAPWGEPAIKQFVQAAVEEALKLERALARLRTPGIIALMHYAPVQQTVSGEPPEIYPFLGSSRLEDPINHYPVSLVFHGHAHRGTHKGETAAGCARLQRLDGAAGTNVPGPATRFAYSTCRWPIAPKKFETVLAGRVAVMSPAGVLPMARHRDDWERRCCTRALTEMSLSGIPFLIGGTYALRRYTFTERHTKDLDVFVMPADVHRVLDFFRALGRPTELPFPHWLGKVFVDGFLMDVIFSSGNGVSRVDEAWFEYAPQR